MSWNLDSSKPIYTQIIEKIQMDILSGKYQPGARLPSVRDLAADAGVNPNTMQKALAELERSNLVHSARTSGRFITEDTVMIDKMRENPFVTQVKLMEEFNLTRKQIQNIIQYLRLNGLVEREGSNRSGKWIVKK